LRDPRRQRSIVLTGEVSCKDEARIRQKNGLVRQWARRGTRPPQPADQRYENAYLFGAICPAKARARRWPCRLPTPTRCNSISRKSAATSQSARMPCSPLTEPAGTPRPNASCPRTSRRSGCPRARPNSIPWKRLAVLAPDLALQTRVRNLRPHRRRRMRGLERAHRPTRHHNFNRHAPVCSRRSEVRALGIASIFAARARTR
jgi:hypothetical protein